MSEYNLRVPYEGQEYSMTTYQTVCLARVSEGETHTRELIGQHGQLFDSTIESMLAPYRALRAVVEIHGAEIRYVNPEYGGSFDTEEEALDGWDAEVDGEDEKPKITTFAVCAHCGGIQKSWCEEGDDWDYMPDVYFPCSELCAIAKELGATP